MYQSWNAFQTFLVKDNCLPTFGATDAILNIARISHNFFVQWFVRINSEIARLFPDAVMRICRPIKGRLALLCFSQENCAKSKHGERCVLILGVSLTKPVCIYWNNHSSADLMNPSRNECKDGTSKTSEFWEYHSLARDGINLLLNNGFEESQKLFRSHRYNNITLNVCC